MGLNQLEHVCSRHLFALLEGTRARELKLLELYAGINGRGADYIRLGVLPSPLRRLSARIALPGLRRAFPPARVRRDSETAESRQVKPPSLLCILDGSGTPRNY